MQTLELGKWYQTGEILTKLQETAQIIPIRCEVQLQSDGTLKLRGEATLGCFPDQ